MPVTPPYKNWFIIQPSACLSRTGSRRAPPKSNVISSRVSSMGSESNANLNKVGDMMAAAVPRLRVPIRALNLPAAPTVTDLRTFCARLGSRSQEYDDAPDSRRHQGSAGALRGAGPLGA